MGFEILVAPSSSSLRGSVMTMKHGTTTVKDIMPELFNSKISAT